MAAKNPPTKPIPDDRLTFPPFPTPPPGVTVIPFKHFKESGIRMFPTKDDDCERDGLGILTIPLRVRHDTDRCKTETSRKTARKAEQQANNAKLVDSVRRTWWEEWADNEESRLSGPYNPHASPLDRLYEAAADFKKGRPWPRSDLGISSNWDQFRLFIGLMSNTPVWTRTDKPTKDEDFSDDDDDDQLEQAAADSAMYVVDDASQHQPRKSKPIRPRPPYALYGADPVPVSSDAEVQDLLARENTCREEDMIEFLNNPVEQIKIFLSSYMRKQGLIWYDRNLVNIPRLVDFFIRFLLRNHAFPESDIERGLRRSLEVISIAQKELILTSKLSKELPDKFSLAARSCWGAKADGYKPAPEDTKPDVDMADSTPENKTEFEEFEAKLKADDIEIINDNAFIKQGEIRQILCDNIDPTVDAIPASGWADSSWSVPTPNENWENTGLGWDTELAWGDTGNNSEQNLWSAPDAEWTPSEIHSIIALMGPTALPNTHTSGIVEWSVRRIKSITEPPAPESLPKSPVARAEPEEDPGAVNIELERRFAKVVLEPWLDWDREEVPHLAFPRILETSRGTVAGSVGKDGRVEPLDQNVASDSAPATEATRLKPHDPLKDDITVLLDPATLPVLGIGLGLGGTWVQMAHLQDLDGGLKMKKKKGKSKIIPQRYWYMDEILMILPSYYT